MSTESIFLSVNTSLSANELIQKAEQLDHAGQTQEAIELYRHWLKHDRTHSKYSVWFNYGWMLQKQNMLTEASAAYDQVINCYADHLSNNAAYA